MDLNTLDEFINSSNRQFYDVITDFVDNDKLSEDFGFTEINKASFTENFITESSRIRGGLEDYFGEIMDSSTPIFSIRCSFESYTGNSSLYIFKQNKAYVVISENSHINENGAELVICKALPIDLIKLKLFEAIEYAELEIENHQSLLDNSVNFSLEVDFKFNLPEFLMIKGLVPESTTKRIKDIVNYRMKHLQ